MTEPWVTVETFVDRVSAQIARSLLEAEGIACYLADEGMGGMFSYGLIRGVRLQVRPEDAARAEEILAASSGDEAWKGDEETPRSGE